MTAGTNGVYVYAIVKTAALDLPLPDGVGGQPVSGVVAGPLTMLVSPVSMEPLRPERRHLLAHQRVAEKILRHTTPLPVSFGTIAESEDELQDFLRINQGMLLSQLSEVDGKAEMALRVRWNVDDFFAFFVDTHPELQRFRDLVFAPGEEADRDLQVALGELFAKLLENDRAQHTETVTEVLEPHCHEIIRNRCIDEAQVMDLACLVAREDMRVFEDAVDEAASHFSDDYRFELTGPWAPYHFAQPELVF